MSSFYAAKPISQSPDKRGQSTAKNHGIKRLCRIMRYECGNFSMTGFKQWWQLQSLCFGLREAVAFVPSTVIFFSDRVRVRSASPVSANAFSRSAGSTFSAAASLSNVLTRTSGFLPCSICAINDHDNPARVANSCCEIPTLSRHNLNASASIMLSCSDCPDSYHDNHSTMLRDLKDNPVDSNLKCIDVG
jgi:hypothetical protein